ncbi:helix-turn-helix domain-containing protein [Nocardia sp. NPDC048505]|uniref:TetR/AcrR family transcriptional regulator n=1 Tax=unclassified Nocardia TaxID=2637762 RepID=UPI0033DD6096
MADVGTKKMPRPERERLILDAATRGFAEDGYAATSLASIAAAAGVTKPLIHSYFGPKEALFEACSDRASANIAAHVRGRLADPTPGFTVTETVLAALFDALAPRPYDWPLLYDTVVPADSGLNRTLREHRWRVAELAVDGVARTATTMRLSATDDIDVATRIWMGTLSTLVRWWLDHPENTAADMVARWRRLTTGLAFLVPRR